MNFLKRAMEIFRPFRWKMIIVFTFIIVQQILSLASPYLQGKAVDAMGAHKPLLYVLEIIGTILIIEMLFKAGVEHWRNCFEIKYLDFGISRFLSRLTLEKVLGLSLAQHIAQNSGVKQNIIQQGEQSTSTLAYTMLYEGIPMFVEIALVNIAIFYLGIAFGITVFVGVALFTASALFFNIRFSKKVIKARELIIESGKIQSEILRNAELVITNAQEGQAVEEHGSAVNKASDFGQNIWRLYSRQALVPRTFISLMLLVVMTLGVIYYYHSSLSLGGFVVLIGWTYRVVGRVSNMGGLQRKIMILYSSVKKYFDLLEIKPDVETIANPVFLENIKGRIEYKNVTLLYRKRAYFQNNENSVPNGIADKPINPALADVSLIIQPGERVAIVGESGSGKTSMVYLLLRGQDPDTGQILIDGQDLRLLDIKQLRENIGLVPQYVQLFDQSLRYNIAYGCNRSVTEQGLWEVAQMACIDRFFGRLENGFETMIGERGVKLSGGERQRVGIARALLRKPAILVFDEATSSLDAENEALIKEAIDKVSQGTTTIIIAHRFSTIKGADRVIVLDKGQIVGQGTHQRLSESCGEYQRLLQHQITS